MMHFLMRWKKCFIVAGIGVLCVSAICCTAFLMPVSAKKAAWRQYERNPWTVSIDGTGIVYVRSWSGEDGIHLVDSDGEEIKRLDAPSDILGCVLIDGHKNVYGVTRYGSAFKPTSQLFSVHPTGKMGWVRDIENLVCDGMVLTDGGEIYVLVKKDNKTRRCVLLCLDRRGDIQWRSETPVSVKGEYTMPMSADGRQLYIAGEDGIYCISLKGKERWHYAIPFEFPWGPRTGDIAVGKRGIYVVAQYRGIYAVDKEGHLRWRRRRWLSSNPVIGRDERIYVCGREHVYGFDSNGKIVFETRVPGLMCTGSPVITGDGSLIVASENGYLYKFNAAGEMVWHSRERGEWSSVSPAVGKDGTIYIVSTVSRQGRRFAGRGVLYAFRDDNGGVLEGTWSTYRGNNRRTGYIAIGNE